MSSAAVPSKPGATSSTWIASSGPTVNGATSTSWAEATGAKRSARSALTAQADEGVRIVFLLNAERSRRGLAGVPRGVMPRSASPEPHGRAKRLLPPRRILLQLALQRATVETQARGGASGRGIARSTVTYHR